MMIQKVVDYVEKHHMIKSGDSIVAGVSGGADSVCLLSVLKILQQKYNLTLQAVHINHMIRGEESDRDEAFTVEFCQQLGVPCEVLRYDVEAMAKKQKLSTEEMGRMMRYEAFQNALLKMPQPGKIAVAHHMDDRAETMLLNLFRGTGLNGLAGIRPTRGNIIRPLLCVTATEIREYLKEQSIAYVIDSTNEEDDYTRNKIRHHVLSYVNREINPAAVQAMNRTAVQLEQMERYFQKLAKGLVEQYGATLTEPEYEVHSSDKNHLERAGQEEQEGSCSKRIILNLQGFFRQEPIVQSYMVMECIRRCQDSLKNITEKHIVDCCELANKEVGKTLVLPRGLRVKKEYEGLCFYRIKQQSSVNCVTAVQTEMPKEILRFTKKSYNKMEKIPNSAYTKWFDYDKIKSRLELRTRKPGDYIIVNEQGGKKKLKDYFIDEKIPKEMRDQILVLADGSHVLWVLGHRISEWYKVTEDTKNLLIVSTVENEE